MREIERIALMLQQMAEALVKTADLIEEADREAAGLFSLEEAQTGSGKAPGLTRMMPDDSTIPAWERDGFGWWAEAFERDHRRLPTEEEYDEFRLSWMLSGEGSVQWEDKDWEAFYHAREAGLNRWVALGMIAGPMTGKEVLAAVEALNQGYVDPDADDAWWEQMITDTAWRQVFLESAARHNRPETNLTNEEFAAVLVAIIRMESGTVGGAASDRSAEDRFKRWINEHLSNLNENERYQAVIFSKTAEIEWNYAYGHEGLMHQILTVGGSLFGLEGARRGYELGEWISARIPLTNQSEGMPNIHPETIGQVQEGLAPLDLPTVEQIERLREEGRLVEREGQYYLRTGVQVHEYGEDSPVAGETFPAAQRWATVPGFIMGGHAGRIRQDQYVEYLAANLEAGIVVALAQEVEMSGMSDPLPVTWAPDAKVEVPRSLQVMAGWAKVGIVRTVGDVWPGRDEAEQEAYEAYAGSIGALYHEILPYLKSQP